MALAAAQVIDVIAAFLVPVSLTGGRVITDRLTPIAEDQMPAWRVIAGDEPFRPATLDGVEEHQLTVDLRGICRAASGLDDLMNNLAAAALTAVHAAPIDKVQLDTEGIGRGMATEGESAVGVVTVRLRATFFVLKTAPETLF